MSFGLGRLGIGFGRLGAGSKRAPLLSAPDAPTLTLTTGVTDNTPGFDVTNVLSGDLVRMQYDTHSDFSAASSVTGTAGSGTISIVTGALADGTWYFRARIERPGYVVSGWSNTETETIDATSPVITSSNTASVAENTTAVKTITATDAGGLSATPYSITGGADSAKFTINSTSGALVFASAPDFETPTDANTDNVYLVQVTATDAAGNTTNQAISVTVTDVSESTTWGTVSTKITKSNGDLTATSNSLVASKPTARTAASTAGAKVYWELHADVITGGTDIVGVINGSADLDQFAGQNTNGIGIDRDGNIFYNFGVTGTISVTYVQGDTIAFCLDSTTATKKLSMRNVTTAGNWNGNVANDPATGYIDVSAVTGPFYGAVSPSTTIGDAYTLTTTQAPPTGFVRL